ncbi:hypothetical protein HNR42_002750 [Deinobacterium chartae]|uniref:Nucleoid-associated protein HNR42_002750 n=1 Tax=Deinobacterium chartae TaxID=521158 RepID=A0A841I5W3_9DEIO|nr:YbaB/EbfC family nucleoid-associated protein [Deinobacterium chartae]MBB6099312.1 hypothetical protein [Deinobacterium chartae]
MDMRKLMKQMQKAQSAAAEIQEKLAGMEVTGSASGMVTVTMNGQGKVLGIRVDPKAVDPEDVEGLEDLLLVALKDAQQKADELQQQETQKSLGFLGGMM